MNGESPERVLLCLRNGVWVEGSAAFLKQEGLLNFINDPACHFLPMSEVRLHRPDSGEPTEVDFLAVNTEDVTFVTVLAGADDKVERDEIVALMATNGAGPAVPPADIGEKFVRWLDEEVTSRLNICRHLLGNGRTDDRSAGIRLVLDEIVAEIQKRSRHVKPTENK